MSGAFEKDVLNGLSSQPKFLPSKYFYDDKGSLLFQQIMGLPEYYLTRSELEVMQRNKEGMLKRFTQQGKPFNLIEFGAGDGLKTKVLLECFSERKADFKYFPIDISGEALDQLLAELQAELPSLAVEGLNNDYFEALSAIDKSEDRQKVVLFMGSNIGNFSDQEAIHFLSELRSRISPGNQLMIGFDLKKDPEMILSAYNDQQGITREFNMNLLRRINRELSANFDLGAFDHKPIYDPISGEARSFLVSLREQEVEIKALGCSFSFAKSESIHTEISRKYDLPKIDLLAKNSGFKCIENFVDSKGYFMDSLWEAI